MGLYSDKYLNKDSSNESEKKVQQYYKNLGYQSLHRGFPDFVFYKTDEDGTPEYVFVEVKRPNQTTIKPAQKKMQNIFRDLGLEYKVAFGVRPDGTPNFSETKSGLRRKLWKQEKAVQNGTPVMGGN